MLTKFLYRGLPIAVMFAVLAFVQFYAIRAFV